MKVNKGIPESNFISYQNVPDEELKTFYINKNPEEIIKAIGEYRNRAVFYQIFKPNVLSVITKIPSEVWIGYLKEISGKLNISKENFIKLGSSNFQEIITTLRGDYENWSLLPFICSKTAQQLGRVLNNYGIRMPNLGKEKEIDLANNKIFLRKNFSEYMVKGKIINLNKEFDINELKKFLKESKGRLLLRLPRSASGLGIRILIDDNLNKTSEQDIYLDELLIIGKSLQINQILAEKLLPAGSFTSPNVVGYIKSNGEVDIFGATDQFLINKIHQGNIYLPKNKEIYKILTKLSKEIAEKLYKELKIIGYFGIDYLVVDLNKIKNIKNYFPDNFKGFFKNYAIVLAEINFRINGGMPLSWVKQLKQFNTNERTLAIINTEKINDKLTDKEIINLLKKNNLLITPDKDNQKGIIIITIMKGKLQYVIIADSKKEIENIREKVKNILN